jgi:hypothetical protein
MRLLLIFLTVSSICQAQLQSLDISNSAIGSGTTRFNNFAELGQKNTNKVDYSEIRGNCFWDKEWNPAILVLKNGTAIKLRKVKLNFNTNDIHYIDNKGTELVAQNGFKKVFFFDRNDTTKLLAVFQSLVGFKVNDVDAYAQLLTEGKIQLLKRTKATLIKGEEDPMLGRPDLKFITETQYYLEEGSSISQLKTINKASLFSLIKPTNEDETWLKANKNKLKNESDIVAFLTYRNSINK